MIRGPRATRPSSERTKPIGIVIPPTCTLDSVAIASLSVPVTSSARTERNAPGLGPGAGAAALLDADRHRRRKLVVDVAVELVQPAQLGDEQRREPLDRLRVVVRVVDELLDTTRSRARTSQRTARITADTMRTLRTLHHSPTVPSSPVSLVQTSAETSPRSWLSPHGSTSSTRATMASQRVTGPQPRDVRRCDAARPAIQPQPQPAPGVDERLEDAHRDRTNVGQAHWCSLLPWAFRQVGNAFARAFR